MKAAKWVFTVVELICPYCDEHLSSDTGSHMFPMSLPFPETIECDCCKKTVKVPARVHKMAAK